MAAVHHSRPGAAAAGLAVAIVAAALVAAPARMAFGGDGDLDDLPGSIHPLLQALLALAWIIPAVLLVRRRPALPFGWLGLLAAATHGAASLAVAIAPSNRWCEWAALTLVVVEVPVLGAIVQLFPTGRPVRGWERYLVATMAAGGLGVVAAAVEALPDGVADPLQPVAGAVIIPFLAFSGLGGIAPLVVRFRRTVESERRAVAMLLAITAVAVVIPGIVALGGRSAEIAAQVFTAGEIAFITVAVLRYRVWGLAPMVRGSLHRAMSATDAERRRMRAELHDGVGAGLTAVRLKVDAAHRIVGERPERAGEMLASASTDLGSLVDDVRRMVSGLRPAVLDRMGLAAALRLRADELSAAAPGLSIVVDDPGVTERLGPGADVAVYRLVTEALNNVVRHAQASHCEVTFRAAADEVVIEVVDDGAGRSDDETEQHGLGLSSMAARAAEAGGYVVAGPAPARGFRVRAVIPGTTA